MPLRSWWRRWGSAFLCGHCGLPASLQHASYVDHWLQALRNDRRLIFTAAALAQKASDYLLAGLVQPEAGWPCQPRRSA
jgi:antirestriction protein ArdC